MKINLIRLSNSLDPNATFKKDDDQFIEDLNNELFEDDIEPYKINQLKYVNKNPLIFFK